MPPRALTGARVFTGEDFRDGLAVLVADGRIAAVVPEAEVPADAVRENLGGLLAPGFVDVQVNGGGGVLFNDTRTSAGLRAIAEAHARGGMTALLPTFITDRRERMLEGIGAAREALADGVPGIVGLHLEGPFLAVARKGAHEPALIRPLTDEDVDLILASGVAPLLLTVAAENASPRLLRRLVEGGVIVSIGHSDAPYAAVAAAADAGARGVTHLFNAMSQLQHRAPGVAGAALDRGDLWTWIIADGHHVDPAALRIAIAAKRGPGRLFLTTDAMPPAGASGDVFDLSGRRATRRDGRLTLDDGTLAGSDLTMDRAVAYAVRDLGVPLAEALRMASLYPAAFLGLDDARGRIKPGYRADLVLLDDALQATTTWIGGTRITSGSKASTSAA